MIEDLLKIAKLQELTGRETTEPREVHWLIDLDAEGRMLQFSPTTAVANGNKTTSALRGKKFDTPKNYHLMISAGEEPKVFRTNSNQHSVAAEFLVYPASQVFPHGAYGSQSVRDKKRRMVWSLIFEASQDERLRNNKCLRAIVRFLFSRPVFDRSLLALADESSLEATLSKIQDGDEEFSFRVAGRLVFHDSAIAAWWTDRCEKVRQEITQLLPSGQDAYQSHPGPLPHFHPPLSRSFAGIALFSYDKAPYQSYGLGQLTTRVCLETSEKMAAALNWLMNDESSSLSLGEYKAVFWATTDDIAVPVDFAQLLNTGDPLAVRDFLVGPWSGSERELDTTKFHAALLRKSGKGRFAVNSWHTDTLGMGRQHVSTWFNALRVPTLQSRESVFVSIRELAECTVRKSKETRPLPATYQTLFEAALFGSPVPQTLLAAVLRRQSLELATGADKKKPKEFENRFTTRTALIQAYFALTRGEPMSEANQNLESNPGYLCGRLLAFLDLIHVKAHRDSGGTNSSPANRAYGAASTTPALIFPQLCKLVRFHLNKIGGGFAKRLEFGFVDHDPPFEGLAAICAKLRTSGAEFPKTLSLEDQGRFAIGFYYERCRPWPAKAQDNTETDE